MEPAPVMDQASLTLEPRNPPVPEAPERTPGKTIRVLHSVGHLARGGIETWLHQMIQRLEPGRFEHHVLVWTDEEEAFTAQYIAAGARVLPCTGYPNPVRFAADFARVVRSHGPYDVLHTHGTHFNGFVMLLARAAGIGARVAHSHDNIRPILRKASPAYRGYAAAGNALIRALATAGVGVTGEAAESMFGPRWRTNPKVRVLHCGVDLRPFSQHRDPGLRSWLGIPPGSTVVGHVGRFEAQKNHAFLIGVAAELARRGSDLHFLLIGDGSLREGFMREVKERGLRSFFTIVRDCDTVPAHMISAMDCFACPSLHEGFPLVLMEAQVAGLPCLVSDGMSRDVELHDRLVRRMGLESGAAAWADALEAMPALRIDNRDPLLRACMERSSINVEQSVAGLARVYEAAVAAAAPEARR